MPLEISSELGTLFSDKCIGSEMLIWRSSFVVDLKFFSPCIGERSFRNPPWIHKALPHIRKESRGERKPRYHFEFHLKGYVKHRYSCDGDKEKEDRMLCILRSCPLEDKRTGLWVHITPDTRTGTDPAPVVPRSWASSKRLFQFSVQEPHRPHSIKTAMTSAVDWGDQALTKCNMAPGSISSSGLISVQSFLGLSMGTGWSPLAPRNLRVLGLLMG